MSTDVQEWALVTGASRGIGLELAHQFAKDGINLIICARTEQRLQELAHEWSTKYGIKVVPFAIDLTQVDAPDALYKKVSQLNVAVHYLVNNAGIGLYGLHQETAIHQEQNMIILNCLSLTKLTKLFLPQMLEKGAGYILNVASVAAFQPGPYQSVYFATKSFVLSYSEAIAEDLKGTGVKVTALCPGYTETAFLEAAEMEESMFFKHAKVATPEFVATVGYRAMQTGKRIAIPGFMNWLTALSPRFVPRRWVTYLVARMMMPIASS